MCQFQRRYWMGSFNVKRKPNLSIRPQTGPNNYARITVKQEMKTNKQTPPNPNATKCSDKNKYIPFNNNSY